MATTTNYGWETPDDSDLVKDGALAIRTLGSAIDTTVKSVQDSISGSQVDADWQSGTQYMLGVGDASTSGFTQATATWVNLVPFYVPNDCTIDQVKVEVGDTATATSYLGIYSADSTTKLPSTLLHSFGSFSGATSGVKTIAASLAITKGTYYFAVKLNQTMSYGIRDGANGEYAAITFKNIFNKLNDDFGRSSAHNYQSITYNQAASGVLESSPGTFVAVSTNMPLIGIRIA